MRSGQFLKESLQESLIFSLPFFLFSLPSFLFGFLHFAFSLNYIFVELGLEVSVENLPIFSFLIRARSANSGAKASTVTKSTIRDRSQGLQKIPKAVSETRKVQRGRPYSRTIYVL